MNGLYYYKLVSEYPEDVTKNCKLTINEIDHDFKTLKDNDIKKAEFVRGEDCTKSDGTLVITKNNDDKIIVPIDVTLCKNLAYDLQVSTGECASGATLSISYKDDSGETSVTLDNIITADNLIDVIGSDVLTKVITDNTLKGLGTMSSPLGIAGVEKTGMLAPAIKMLDLTDGSKLPEKAAEGTRYVTREYVSDYGYLYNGSGVKKISDKLDYIYQKEQIYKEVEGRNFYWRVPSKADWDALLNSIEPCDFKNHHQANCHAELGKFAGKFLKSECGWVWQPECTCNGNKPHTGCTYENSSIPEELEDDYVDDSVFNEIPEGKKVNPVGIDKYGMKILPAGVSAYINGTPKPTGFKEMAAFWTTTHIYNDLGQDIYIKEFDYNRSGVYQVAECPDPYYSVRLVKDYDGSNFREVEYIDGVLYKAILFPESKQIWLASNFANTTGFIGYGEGGKPDYLLPNNGDGIADRRIEMFINEYNGRYWEKKVMDEGVTIVIQNPCFDYSSGYTAEVCWEDSEGIKHCVTIEVPKVSQSNLEYRVYLNEDTCEKYLRNTDDLVVERVLSIIVPMLEQERTERIEEDLKLWDAISAETEERIAADEALSGAIEDLRDDVDELSGKVETISGDVIELREDLEAEISARTEADEVLSGAIDTEREERITADIILDGQLIDWTQNPFILNAATADGEYNLVLPSKDGEDEHFIKIKFDGNFGEF